MALDQAYFDAIQIDVVKKKYYNANKVEALLKEIREQAIALQEENDRLRRQAEALRGRKDEISETLVSAKAISQQIIRDAEEQAEAMLAEARDRSREQFLAGVSREEEQRRRMDAYVQSIRGRLIDCADEIGADWRALVSGQEEAPPADLEEKVGAIARELFASAEDE